jgi:hypothetical protein
LPLPCKFDVGGPDPHGEDGKRCFHSRWYPNAKGEFCDDPRLGQSLHFAQMFFGYANRQENVSSLPSGTVCAAMCR